MIRIGVDLGGTKIEAIALDDAGRELARRRIATPSQRLRATVEAVRGLVDELEAELGARAQRRRRHAGRDLGGDRADQERQLDALNGRPFADDLARALGREVRIENDANCFALSEAIDGAGAGQRVVFGVILGTGVGGGIVVDGRVWVGPNAIAGEWGHNALPSRDRARPARPALLLRPPRLHRDLPVRARGSPPTTRARAAPRRARSMRRRSSRSRAAGDAAARATLARYDERLARALATVINVLDPDVIVLGGGLSNIERALRRGRARCCRRTSSPTGAHPRRAQPPRRFVRRARRGVALAALKATLSQRSLRCPRRV